VGRLSGKRAFVTAAGQGIGRASALAMAREGAEVIATDVNEAALATLAEEAVDGGVISTCRLDVLDAAAVTAAVGAAGRIDVLFNCAGFVHHGTILDCDEEAWDFSMRLNMTAMYRMCRAVLPGMIAQGGGSIINMASVASGIIAAPTASSMARPRLAWWGSPRRLPATSWGTASAPTRSAPALWRRRRWKAA
jgi:2-keto-3-deoxy-L-fuconate dehydrogenase